MCHHLVLSINIIIYKKLPINNVKRAEEYRNSIIDIPGTRCVRSRGAKRIFAHCCVFVRVCVCVFSFCLVYIGLVVPF